MSDDRRLARMRLFAPLAALLLLLAGRTHAEPAAPALIGKAGPVELTDGDARRIITALPAAGRAQVLANPSALEQLVRNELVRRLLLGAARSQGFDRDPAVGAEVERLREDIVARLWLEREAKVPADYPSEAEVGKAYEAARERAAAVADYRLAQIFIAIPDGAPADKVAAALKKVAEVQARLGGDFAALARTYSDHAESALKGGDLGLLPESRLMPEVRAVLAAMKPGDVAGPIKTAQGIHFVRLVEKKPAVAVPLAEVHDALVQALRQQRASELQQRYLSTLAGASPPSINEVELGKLRERLK